MKGLIRAIQNLTRIYIMDVEISDQTFGQATKYFPLVGLIIGGLLWLISYLGNFVFPHTIIAALIVVVEAVITGGMHLDGFTDSMDGLFSGRSRERKLEIMKDSRVGSVGALGLVSLFLLKYVLIMELLALKNPLWLLIVPSVSRWYMVYGIRFFPYARPEGMGKPYHDFTTNKEFAWATVFTLLISAILLNPWLIAVLATGLLITHWMASGMTKSIGGLTGDTYGAINEIMELILLLMFYILLKF